jgi:hypothetical protein
VIGFIAEDHTGPENAPSGGEDCGTRLATAVMSLVCSMWLLSSLSVPREGRPRPPLATRPPRVRLTVPTGPEDWSPNPAGVWCDHWSIAQEERE